MTVDVKSQTREELQAHFSEWAQPSYRVDQLLQWLYERRAISWSGMTNLPKALRDQLAAAYSLDILQLVRKQGASDTTQKFLWRLNDASMIESVLIPANPALYGERSDRHTLCVSTQVGCAYGCGFCASGLEGWKRNLRVDEIVEQVLAVELKLTARRFDQAQQAAPDGGFAATGFAHQTERFAAPNPERHAVNSTHELFVRGGKVFLEVFDFDECLLGHHDLRRALPLLACRQISATEGVKSESTSDFTCSPRVKTTPAS